jgi:thiol-disulfide isomerase/thioredoxin
MVAAGLMALSQPPAGAPGKRTGRRVIGPFNVRHLLALTLTVGLTGGLIVILTSPIGPPPGSTTPVPGASFYLIREGGTGLAIGDKPPSLSAEGGPLLDLDGASVDLLGLEGRPVWVVFWATWCPPCQQETPDLQRAYEANLGTGLELVAVNVQESAGVARDYATTYGLTYRIALDPTGGAFRGWGIFGMPTHYFIGRDGRIRDRWFGPLSLAEMQRRVDLIEGT